MRFTLPIIFALATGSLFAAVPPEVGTSWLTRLVLEGHDLHPSLATPRLDDKARHVPRGVLHSNPELSSDCEFVNAIARSGSQGNLSGEGIRSALYALYFAEKEVGLYGLEAATEVDANRLEAALRKIWSHNESIDRAQVHRKGLVLVVVWNDGISSESWDAVNVAVEARLASSR